MHTAYQQSLQTLCSQLRITISQVRIQVRGGTWHPSQKENDEPSREVSHKTVIRRFAKTELESKKHSHEAKVQGAIIIEVLERIG
jgi:hypothetical protein